ncbi:DUF2798 domain-containing protein [Limibaculum sp. M0105]|uniref:DUF2798 domain-containing protein n=1 Tax=Thermohalobaculum xanthum TaxID=2753746 RepID=A0A8J7SJA1_9RHOB|nr:DUF2798 domain-containing protein [Thermohalobaculum xanthum]MBK0400835.1 DUF2798 domain-containing protein [Thermohalobaculum xanthum]
MIPSRLAPLLFALILSGVMSFLVTGIATLSTQGLVADFHVIWLGTWLRAWPVAFPAAFVFAPIVRRLVARLVRAS